jgi:hypothetical protein
MKAKDILSHSNGDPIIVNGDLVWGESDHQHVADIMWSKAGSWREFPKLGADYTQFTNEHSPNNIAAKNELLKQFIYDGFQKITFLGTNSVPIIKMERPNSI